MMINFKINSSQVDAELKRRIAKAQQTQNLTKVIAGDLESSVDANFRAEGRQPRWQRLKDKTLMARARKGKTGKRLQVSGRLKNSIVSKYDKSKAVIGTNLRYAAIHQYGGLAGRNHAAKIPARPYLKLSKRENRNINEKVRKYFE